MEDIKWGIIGCGDVTEKKSGPAFSKIKCLSLHMVMRRDEVKLKDYAKRHNVKLYSTDYLDLLKNPDIDAIYIATPPNMHCFYTLEAAKYKKAVYVEKPMALSVDECRKMIDACRENEVPLYVAYYRQGQDKFNALKNIISSGEIGEILSFNYLYSCKSPTPDQMLGWRFNPDIAGDGLLYDIGSHMIDITLFLLGDVRSANGISKNQSLNPKVNEVISGIIEFKSGMQGTMQLSFNADNPQDEFIITGDKGSVTFSVMSNDPIKVINQNEERFIKFAPIEHVQMPFIKKIVKDMNGKDILDSEGLYGLKTQEILEAFAGSKSIEY